MSSDYLDPGLQISVVPVGDGLTRVSVRGELDVASSPSLQVCLERELSAGHGVELDLSGVPFIDSSGIRVLLIELGSFAQRGFTFAVRTPLPDQVRRVLELTGVLERLPVASAGDG
jgi:anti-sigma B factor antagonist